jgi:hypothetical protein
MEKPNKIFISVHENVFKSPDIVYPQQLPLICYSVDLLYGPEYGRSTFHRKAGKLSDEGKSPP